MYVRKSRPWVLKCAFVTFYSSLTLVANYLGHRPKELVEWEDDTEKVMPRIFVTADTDPAT
jgi:hypothetical protein